MLLTRIRHNWPEKKGFQLIRPKGYPEYTFLHFLTPVTMELNGTTLEIVPGGCIFFPPEMPQFFTASVPLVHNWFHATTDLTPLLKEYSIPKGQVFYPENRELITELIAKMEAERFGNQPYTETLLNIYVQELFILLSRNLHASISPGSSKNSELLQIRQIRQQILSRPTHRWTVEEMADLVGLSVSRFHAVYKTHFGISPMQDLINSRIEYAKDRLLLQPETPIGELAERLGYHDQFHFIRQFHKEVGVTPGQFRKMNHI